MSFVNEKFYHGLLSNGVSAEQRPTPAGFNFHASSAPLVFIAVNGRETTNARGSKLNEMVGQHAACHDWCGVIGRLLSGPYNCEPGVTLVSVHT